MAYDQIPSKSIVEKTIESLKANNITAVLAENAEDAKAKALSLIPQGAEVMTMTSITLETLGIDKEINEDGKYNSVRNKLNSMDRNTQSLEMQKLGAAPEYAIGSVHAVTENGEVIIVSNTGSQLPAYAYGSAHIIWVVGTQKIVKDKDDGMKRIYEYTLPLESERAHKAYGVDKSNVSKVLIVNKELNPSRINIIFVNENIGF